MSSLWLLREPWMVASGTFPGESMRHRGHELLPFLTLYKFCQDLVSHGGLWFLRLARPLTFSFPSVPLSLFFLNHQVWFARYLNLGFPLLGGGLWYRFPGG